MSFDPKKYGKVAVILGGISSERDISLVSGNAAYDVLINLGIDAHKVDPKEGLVKQFTENKFDRAFIILHGTPGEDGTMQGFLDSINVPYTGSNVLSSAITMDKVISKKIWLQSDLPVLPFIESDDSGCQEQVIAKFGLPLCVKPPNEGSSYGVTKVKSADQFQAAFKLALQYHPTVLMEPWVEGRELSLPVFDGEAYPIVEIIPKDEFYTYKAKYDDDAGTEFPCPADIPADVAMEVESVALRAYQTTHCSGLARVDFMLDKDNKPWLMEVNTIPGLTEHSLSPTSFRSKGLDFEALVVKMLDKTLTN